MCFLYYLNLFTMFTHTNTTKFETFTQCFKIKIIKFKTNSIKIKIQN